MSRDKQTEIEEMARDLCECYVDYDTGTIDIKATSEKLFAKSYRKSTDVAEEIFAEIEEKISLDLDVISKEKDELIYKGFFSHALLCEFNYKINTLRGISKFIAELKKKYTKSEKDNDT